MPCGVVATCTWALVHVVLLPGMHATNRPRLEGRGLEMSWGVVVVGAA